MRSFKIDTTKVPTMTEPQLIDFVSNFVKHFTQEECNEIAPSISAAIDKIENTQLIHLCKIQKELWHAIIVFKYYKDENHFIAREYPYLMPEYNSQNWPNTYTFCTMCDKKHITHTNEGRKAAIMNFIDAKKHMKQFSVYQIKRMEEKILQNDPEAFKMMKKWETLA